MGITATFGVDLSGRRFRAASGPRRMRLTTTSMRPSQRRRAPRQGPGFAGFAGFTLPQTLPPRCQPEQRPAHADLRPFAFGRPSLRRAAAARQPRRRRGQSAPAAPPPRARASRRSILIAETTTSRSRSAAQLLPRLGLFLRRGWAPLLRPAMHRAAGSVGRSARPAGEPFHGSDVGDAGGTNECHRLVRA